MLSWNHHSECKRERVSSVEVIALTHNVCLLPVLLLSSTSSSSTRSLLHLLQPLLLLFLFRPTLYLSVHINCVVIASFGVRCINAARTHHTEKESRTFSDSFHSEANQQCQQQKLKKMRSNKHNNNNKYGPRSEQREWDSEANLKVCCCLNASNAVSVAYASDIKYTFIQKAHGHSLLLVYRAPEWKHTRFCFFFRFQARERRNKPLNTLCLRYAPRVHFYIQPMKTYTHTHAHILMQTQAHGIHKMQRQSS